MYESFLTIQINEIIFFNITYPRFRFIDDKQIDKYVDIFNARFYNSRPNHNLLFELSIDSLSRSPDEIVHLLVDIRLGHDGCSVKRGS